MPVRQSSTPPAAPAEALHGRHVLVVGIHYPPEPVDAAGWTAALADEAAALGASVTVLAGMPHAADGRIDERYRGLHRLVTPSPNGAGATVVRLGHHAPAAGPGGDLAAGDDVRYQLSFARRAVTARLPRCPDLVVGVMPSAGAAAAAARIARRHGVPLVVAVHRLADPGEGRSLARRLERHALARAERVVVADRSLAGALGRLGVVRDRVTTGLDPAADRGPVSVPVPAGRCSA